MNRSAATRRVIAALALSSGLLVTACNGSSSSSSSGSAPNPVQILQKLDGCVLPAGAVQGDTDMNGDRMAECSYQDNQGTDGTSVTVYTNTSKPDLPGITADDSHKIITGKDFVLEITGDWSAYSAHIDPAQIAKQVGGSVQ